MRSNRSHFLDWARVLAAHAVCLGHMRVELLPVYEPSAQHPPWFSAIVFMSGFGDSAVIVFFVISGWQVGGQLLGKSFSPGEFAAYAIDRVARFGCVLVPLILGTRVLFAMHLLPVPPESVGLKAAIVNLLSLQTILGPQYGNNYPLWSLANEWCYYFCGPLLVLAVASMRIELLILSGAILAAYLTAVDLRFLSGGILWVLAAYFGKLHLPKKSRAAAIPFLAAIVAARLFRWFENPAVEFAIGLLFLNCAIALREARTKLDWMTRFQPYTFSLYVVHVPIIVALKAFGLRVQVDAVGLCVFGAAFFGVNAGAFAFYWFFERHYLRVRAWLKTLLLSDRVIDRIPQSQ
jgi:peptidoglycan/LPS O-acetylase OafA/YrhL